MSDLKELVNSSMLYDFYNKLLTEKQCLVYEMYHMQDFSLNEISQEWGISKQAVYDLLKRTDNLLKSYESKLELVKKYEANQKKAIEINNSLDKIISSIENSQDIKENPAILKSIRKDVENIVDM